MADDFSEFSKSIDYNKQTGETAAYHDGKRHKIGRFQSEKQALQAARDFFAKKKAAQ